MPIGDMIAAKLAKNEPLNDEEMGKLRLFLNQADLNSSYVSGLQNGMTTPTFLETAVGAKVRLASFQAIVNSGAGEIISWDTEDYDDNEFFSSSDPTKISIKSTGYYLIIAEILFASNATGIRTLSLLVNGSVDIFGGQDGRPAFSGSSADPKVVIEASLTSGDYVELVAFQTSGSDLNALAVLTIRKIITTSRK